MFYLIHFNGYLQIVGAEAQITNPRRQGARIQPCLIPRVMHWLLINFYKFSKVFFVNHFTICIVIFCECLW